MKRIKNLGIHFHRKTQNIAEWKLTTELEDLLEKETLESISIINIGGGLPSFYANTNKNVLDSIKKQIILFKDYLNKNSIKLMIEPGRFISAPSVELHTTIKLIHGNNLIVDASVYNTDMDALIVPVKLLVKGEYSKEDSAKDNEIKPYVIKGITPCSMDLFRYRVYLKKPKQGDEIVFLNAGAYNFTTTFCDLDELETKVLE
jgi:ornithine decarboxylase